MFTPDRAVFVNRLDGHMALANSYALRLAGVTRDTADPPGGLIVRDAKTGEPTGVLKDAAQDAVWKVFPEHSFEEKMDAARAATAHAAAHGVTSVQDMSAGTDVGVYQSLLNRGELKTRIYAVMRIPEWERIAGVGILRAFGGDMLRIGGLKGFSDGSLGSTTALFFEPYLDAPDTRGLPADDMFPEGLMLKRVEAADAAGLQVMIHAIGDKANDNILSIYEQVAREHGPRDRRFRIEHAQHLRPQDIARFGRDHVVASMQPYHCIDGSATSERRRLTPSALCSIRAQSSPSAPTGLSPRSTPSSASTPPPRAALSTAKTRGAGFPNRRSRSKRPCAHTPSAPPTPSSPRTRRVPSRRASSPTW